MTPSVPAGLRRWFILHFVIDILFAIPLLLAPVFTLSSFGWSTIDPLASRLVGAALVGIGVESFLGRTGSVESFRTMLRLKILWSLAAGFGIALTIFQGAPTMAWVLLLIFGSFSGVWIYYWRRLRS
ncbi:MAG: hypothetical protein ABJB74_14860 [Gemmatimonas sp.]